MATTLPPSPTPKNFAVPETRIFAAAVRQLAGKDGRLSANEASKASEKLQGTLRLAIDNIEGYFATTGVGKPRVNAMIRSHYGYAIRKADAATGGDGRLSSKDAANLPQDLQDNFLYLRRGVLPPAK